MKNLPRNETAALSLDKGARAPSAVHVTRGESGVAVTAAVEAGGELLDMTGRAVAFEWAHKGARGSVAAAVDGTCAAWTLPAFDAPGEVESAYLRVAGDASTVCTNDLRIIVR